MRHKNKRNTMKITVLARIVSERLYQNAAGNAAQAVTLTIFHEFDDLSASQHEKPHGILLCHVR